TAPAPPGRTSPAGCWLVADRGSSARRPRTGDERAALVICCSDVSAGSANPRGILPLDAFHVPRTLRQVIRKDPPVFEIRINYDFEATMHGCMTGHKGG